MNKGKLIVIEGSDGAGKTTQLNLLKGYLEKKNLPVKTIDFPRYTESFFGDAIARFLRGEFGKLSEVNPYLISIVYAADRAAAKDQIDTWLGKDNTVLSNRYATSNMAHQAGRISKRKRNAFLSWDLELEYEVNKIPKEDIVVFLHVPYKISKKLMHNADRQKDYRKKGRKKDMVEKDETYLKNAEEVYLSLVKKFPHWVKITCVDRKGNLLSREDIHEEIVKVLKKKKILL